ncbi:helix-turn-helix transcriptional regulator [Mycobacteroides franklinii]|uniref:helix-turn-helix transcriptional regulator n=1 Tax=Mycobacteroides franklinii TaxID=948102 RepID=UPI0012FFA4FE|nr:helix-turn-helix domain-containing protein [Mycobacteroides franklinii]
MSETAVRDYYTAKEVAHRLGVSVQALSYWRAKNIGPKSVKLVGTLRYPVAAFEAWKAAQDELTARGDEVAAS